MSEKSLEKIAKYALTYRATIFLATLLLTISITLWRGIRQDYFAYTQQWALILSNDPNPWGAKNAYGPLHNTLAYLYYLSPMLPKVYMVMAYLIIHIAIVNKIICKSNPLAVVLALSIFPFNFTFISIAASEGNNDALVAAIVGLAILLIQSSKVTIFNALIACAVLLKFYPAILAPFFALKLNANFRTSIFKFFTFTASGMVIAYFYWGPALLTPFKFGSEREPRMFSFLAFLDRFDYFSDNSAFHFLVRVNFIFVLVGVLLFFIYSRKTNWDEMFAATTGLFIALLIYKVGNSQFYLTWLTVVLGGILLSDEIKVRAYLPYVVFGQFLSIYQLGYELTGWYLSHLTWVREYLGLIAFIPTITVLAWVFLPAQRKLVLKKNP
jgi:hypothetical protein